MAAQGKILKPDELAQRLGVTVETLANWRARKSGPRFARLGSWKKARIVYREADVDAWLESMTEPQLRRKG